MFVGTVVIVQFTIENWTVVLHQAGSGDWFDHLFTNRGPGFPKAEDDNALELS